MIINSVASDKLISQVIALAIGLVAMMLIWGMEKDWLEERKIYIYGLVLLLLLLPLLIGIVSHGASRWLSLGWGQFQPSEIIKPWLIVAIGAMIKDFKIKGKNWLIVLALIGLPSILIASQPDLGNAIVLGLTLFLMAGKYFGWKWLVASLLLAGLISPLVFSQLKFYQKERIWSFADPTRDPQGSSYNQIQAKIAIGSGQFWGKGLGKGTQTQLEFLPEAHTDFIFATIAEELGFVGVVILVTAYFYLFYFIFDLGSDGSLIVFGLGLQLFIQTVINLGMNLQLMPITGITLPFISVGGSSLVASLMSLGLIFGCYNQRKG